MLVVAIGACFSSVTAGFLRQTPEVQAATAHFLNEYNRLARLAAEAPDIHIIQKDPRTKQNIRIDRPAATARHPNLLPQQPQQQHHHHQAAPAPLPRQASNQYAYSATLGSNQQFLPNQFRSAHQREATHHSSGRPHTFAAAQSQRQQQQQQPRRYTGPFAHTVPAGVNGLPTVVRHTPAVEAARQAHFQALASAYRAIGVHQL